ncbi:MAG: hypothetical protein QOH10_2883 [Actinomycetota bacterium]|jgi:hypothetical protein|nr:hypothetical protein [Actinomycetota bacterium]
MLNTRVLATMTICALALAACGSSGKTKTAATQSSTSTTSAPTSSSSAAPTTTTANPDATEKMNALSAAVTDHLTGFHKLAGMRAFIDTNGLLKVRSTYAPGDSQNGITLCTDAAMVAGAAAMTIEASDGTKIAGRDTGGACS